MTPADLIASGIVLDSEPDREVREIPSRAFAALCAETLRTRDPALGPVAPP